jgi:hypothetical protein
MPGIGGTGQLARRLASEIEALGFGSPTGVTRHQLFEGPGVPKTSRNSAAAIAFVAVESSTKVLEVACEIVSRESIAGSDPAVAMGNLPPGGELVHFARTTQNGLVTQDEARKVAATHAIEVVGLGGTEDGVIGALAATVLRINGCDGRFVGLPGIRDVSGPRTVAEVLDLTEIADIVDIDGGKSLEPGTTVDLGDWVRPRLIRGQPVLVARLDAEGWVNADSRSK